MTRVVVDLPPILLRDMKELAQASGGTLTDVVREACEASMADLSVLADDVMQASLDGATRIDAVSARIEQRLSDRARGRQATDRRVGENGNPR